METAKSKMIGAAFAGVIASSSMALDVQFSPETVYFLSRVAGDNFGQEEVYYPDAEGGNVVLNNHGVALNSSLEIVRQLNQTQVILSVSMALAPEGNLGLTEFSGEFQITEPAFLQFFGEMDGDSAFPDAVCFLYAAQSSLDGAPPQYEYDYQFGQSPDLIAVNGQIDGMGFLEGAIHQSRLLPAGSYFFVLQLSSWDNAFSADTAFGSTGITGFTVTAVNAVPEPEPEPEVPVLGDLLSIVDGFAIEGEIEAGVANAVKAKIHQAIQAQEKGKAQKNALKSLKNQIRAQSGKKIAKPAADQLLDLIETLEAN